MPDELYIEDVVNDLTDEGVLSDEDARNILNGYKAGNAAKKVPERLEAVVVGTAMLTEMKGVVDEELEQEINEAASEVQEYRIDGERVVDWESHAVYNDVIEEHFFDQASGGADVTEEGAQLLDNIDDQYNRVIDIWSEARDYIENEYAGERNNMRPQEELNEDNERSPVEIENQSEDPVGSPTVSGSSSDVNDSDQGSDEEYDFGMMEYVAIGAIKVGKTLNFGGDDK